MHCISALAERMQKVAPCLRELLVSFMEQQHASHHGTPTKHPGILDASKVSREDAEAMIMQARVKAGCISEADLAKPAEEIDASEEQPA